MVVALPASSFSKASARGLRRGWKRLGAGFRGWLGTLAARHLLFVVFVVWSTSLAAVCFDEAVDLSVAALDVRAHFVFRVDA